MCEPNEVLIAQLHAREGLTQQVELEAEALKFELSYRFTPFAKDNKKDRKRPPDKRIGGKCPLELAGYDISQIPIA